VVGRHARAPLGWLFGRLPAGARHGSVRRRRVPRVVPDGEPRDRGPLPTTT